MKRRKWSATANDLQHLYLRNITYCVITFFFIFFYLGCSSFVANSGSGLSTPEITYETVQKAISEKNFENYAKCFYFDNSETSRDNLRLATELIFNKMIIHNHKILQKVKISDVEYALTVEEDIEWADGTRSKSRAVLNFIRINNDWKIASQTESS